MKNEKNLAIKYIIVTIAQIIIGIGVGFMVTSGMGNDPMGVMVSGISIKTGISFGTVTNAVNMVMFVAIFIFYRKRISWTTLITVVAVGWSIDPAIAIISKWTVPVWVNNYVYPIVGCLIIGTGVAFYLSMNMGASITDNVILMIGDFAKKGYSFGCYTLYAIYFSLGLLFGGVWGYATFISFLITGRVVDFTLPKFQNIAKKLKLI